MERNKEWIKKLFSMQESDRQLLPVIGIGGIWALFTTWVAAMHLEGTFFHSLVLTFLLTGSIVLFIFIVKQWLVRILFVLVMVAVMWISLQMLPDKYDNEFRPKINFNVVVSDIGSDKIKTRLQNDGGSDLNQYKLYACISQLGKNLDFKNVKWDELKASIKKKGGSQAFSFELGDNKTLIKEGNHILFVPIAISSQIKQGFIIEPFYTWTGGKEGWRKLGPNLGALDAVYQQIVNNALQTLELNIQDRIRKGTFKQKEFEHIIYSICKAPIIEKK